MTEHPDEATPRPLSVLVVCRANRYRSPLAQHLLQASFDAAGVPAAVSSAGTDARSGEALDPAVAALLGDAGVTASPGWRSTRLTSGGVEGADLVLTSDHSRSADVTRLNPAALRSVFTVRQFARFMRAVSGDDASLAPATSTPGDAVRAQVDRLRGRLPMVPPAQDDLQDPVRRPATLLRRCATLLGPDVEDIARGVHRILAAPKVPPMD